MRVRRSIVILLHLLFLSPASYAATSVTEDFSQAVDPSEWQLYGDTRHDLGQGWIELTPDAFNQLSSGFCQKPINAAAFEASKAGTTLSLAMRTDWCCGTPDFLLWKGCSPARNHDNLAEAIPTIVRTPRYGQSNGGLPDGWVNYGKSEVIQTCLERVG